MKNQPTASVQALRKQGWLRNRWLHMIVFIAVAVFVLWITGCMERNFYYPTSELTPVPRHLVGAEPVWFQSADGTRLHGWFIPAHHLSSQEDAEAADQRAPTVLHVHGNAGNIASHVWFTEYLPPAGFNVFVFDYRGYGQSEGSATKRGPLIADTHAALDAILARSDVDPQRIGLYGQSLGGAIGINVMAMRPELKAAVIESAFASWREMAACAVGGDLPNLLCRALAAVLIPDTHRPDQAIAAMQRPILLLHGDADSIVPVSHARKLAAAAGGQVTLLVLPGGDHNSLRETHPEVEQHVIDFLHKHLARSTSTKPK